MAKVTLNDILGGYGQVADFNANNALIEQAFENTLSRDGTDPNQMESDLDMNSYDVVNVDNMFANAIFINGISVQPGDVLTIPGASSIIYSPGVTVADAIGTNAAGLATEISDRVAAISDLTATVIANALASTNADIDLQAAIDDLESAAAQAVYVQATPPVPGLAGVPNPIPSFARWYDSDDNNKPYIWDDVGLVWVNVEDLRIGVNEADITALDVRVTSSELNITANASAISVLDATVVALDGTVAVIASDVTTLQSQMTVAQGDILTNAGGIATNQGNITANASAISGLTTRVTTAEGNISVNASDITNLDSRLTTAEGTVLANSSAITILQTDVTTNAGNITTNASNITGLDSRLTTAEGNISGNASAISSLTTTVNTNTGNITTNANAITALDVRVTTAEGDILANASAVSGLDTRVTTAEGNISTNASAITTLETDVDLRATAFRQATAPTANNTGDLWFDSDDGDKLYRWSGTAWVNVQDAAISGNASAITALDSRVTVNEGDITATASDVTALTARVTTNEGDIVSANVNIGANATAITTAEGDILTLEAKYGVSLDVNGYVTGFVQNNDGTSGSFEILADTFAVATPSTTWAASTAYTVGDTIRPTTPNSRVFKCTTAGTSGGTEPTWNTTVSGTTNDNTVVWTTFNDTALLPFLISGNTIVMNSNVEISGDLLTGGTIQAVKFQTAASGQRIVIDESVNELQLFGDRGDATIEEILKIGADLGITNIILDIGSANTSQIAIGVETTGSRVGSTFLHTGSGDTISTRNTGTGIALSVEGSDSANAIVATSGEADNIAAVYGETAFQASGTTYLTAAFKAAIVASSGFPSPETVHMRMVPHGYTATPTDTRGQTGDMVVMSDNHFYYRTSTGWECVSHQVRNIGSGTTNLLKEWSGNTLMMTSTGTTVFVLPAAAAGIRYDIVIAPGAFSSSNTKRVRTTGANIICDASGGSQYDTLRWNSSTPDGSRCTIFSDGTYWYVSDLWGNYTWLNDI